MTDATTAAAPVCAHCGNTGAIGAGLYLAVDARWDAQQRAWLLQEREDTGGAAWDCLECDQQTPVYGDAALFPYGATLPNDKHLIGAGHDMLAALQWAVEAADTEQYEACWYAAARAAIAKATGA
jgi:hypothetical protein